MLWRLNSGDRLFHRTNQELQTLKPLSRFSVKHASMPPAANTARPRKAPTTAIHPGSDSDSDGYLSRLREAEAARGRLKKVRNNPFHVSPVSKDNPTNSDIPLRHPQAKQTRDAKRKALAAAYQHHLAAIQDRVHKSVTLYQDLQ